MPREHSFKSESSVDALYLRTERHQIIILPTSQGKLEECGAAMATGKPFSMDLDKLVFVGVLSDVQEAIKACLLSPFNPMHAPHAESATARETMESQNDD